MKTFFLVIIFFFTLSCKLPSKIKNEVFFSYGQPIPFLLSIDNKHNGIDSFKIVLIDNFNNSILIHKGAFYGRKMRWMDDKVKTGEYLLVLSWKVDDQKKQTKRKILIKPDIDFFSLNITMPNIFGFTGNYCTIYLDQYSKSIDNIEFKKKWNPIEQFNENTALLPDYTVINKSDNIVYGAKIGFSIRRLINWIESSSDSYIIFEQIMDSNWIPMPCKGQNIEMNLKPGEEGKTQKDFNRGCKAKNFNPGELYRIRINYILDEPFFENILKEEGIEEALYREQIIYFFTDEFRIEKSR